MNIQNELWKELLHNLVQELDILPDKAEETPETTLSALWWKACGNPLSVVAAKNNIDLPELSSGQEKILRELIDRRLSGVPLAHLTGRQHFMGLELLASADALVPRKETELLAGEALNLLKKMATGEDHLVYIDVCTGAGNLPVALASQVPGVKAFAADLSADAVHLAQENVDFFDLGKRIKVLEGDLLSPFESEEFFGKVDLLTCNPPYISSGKVADMHSEISDHEPDLAFDGGPFGIAILRKLIGEAPRYLRSGGWLAFEVGLGQGEKMIKRMKKKYDYELVRPVLDENHDIRAILAQM
ncbi:MAG TPA: peptide chain release factor N(5)-glutamine methyltransferase [Desulfobacterales bacterium]|nr:peptide chain release factor N(5)-glutamine methyltransferase [Desulfobacterales bacterium]HIP38209.1 peptide chain release factor N(5)-glutamine methyltransferase [Desulfocapsa sulfexigens]